LIARQERVISTLPVKRPRLYPIWAARIMIPPLLLQLFGITAKGQSGIRQKECSMHFAQIAYLQTAVAVIN
jgi:hypothetical protein